MGKRITFPYLLNRPIIPIQIKNKIKNIWITTEGYVDSGASFSIFSINDAIRIGIDYQRGKEIYVTVGDGGVIPVHLHNLTVRIGDIPCSAVIGFSPRLGVGFNLIGRKGFFEYFDVTFSDTSQTTTFLLRKQR